MCAYACIEFIDFMFPGKTLINYTSLLKKWQNNLRFTLKINEATNIYSNLSDQTKLRLSKINKM